jgi:formylglycine-generating enzyme required for sulfatase activity
MRRWFLSYNAQDLALMQGLEAALRRKDSAAKIFFAPTSLRAGGFWLPELAKGIVEATAFVLLVGEKGLGPWQVIEYYEALDRRVKQHDFPVILVLLDGVPAPGLPFLRQLHWIINADPTSEQSVARIMDAAVGGGSLPGELWRHTAPYRGLAAMEEKDSDYFFGREDKTVEVVKALEATPDKLPILLGNSGVGKSSLAQAGVLAAFMRQGWPETARDAGTWPRAFNESRTWCVLTFKPGTEPVRALVEPFIRTWQFDPTDPRRETRQTEWIEKLAQGTNTLRGLLDATEDRLQELGQSKPPAFLIYIDQGEELYVRAEAAQRHRFSKILAEGLTDPRLHAFMSLRADFTGELQKDEPLFAVHRQINVPPLRRTELHEVVSRPAALLSARFETERLAADVADRTAEESAKDAGALPLLSYLLDDMWTQMVRRGDGVLRLPTLAVELGGVLVDRANAFLDRHPQSNDLIRRIFTFKLATVREDGEPTRRRAMRSEFSDREWRLVSELADHPNRLLVTATPEAAETYVEAAHEAIFRSWDKLREWITAEREFLIWRSGLEPARRAWLATPDESKSDALLMGIALVKAQSWLDKRAEDLSKIDREFIDQSLKREVLDTQQRHRLRRQKQRMQILVGVLIIASIAAVLWLNQAYLKARIAMLTGSKPLTAESERAFQPKQTFGECDRCPEMVVVPAGEFLMGSPPNEKDRRSNEGPQHKVTIANQFAVSRFEVTFDEWDRCVILGGCTLRPDDVNWGRDNRPVINVSWEDAQQYVRWLSSWTGKPYRLLSEAEWEYAARAGSVTAYSWGDDVGEGKADCDGCGSRWDNQQTAPVGSFRPNEFGLFDMAGNVWEWVQDCYQGSYEEAPADGSARAAADCHHVLRGGSWYNHPKNVRSAIRVESTPGTSLNSDPDRPDTPLKSIGFRVARKLLAPSR